MQYNKAIRHYILEIVLIVITIVLSYAALEYNEKVVFWGNQNNLILDNYFWMPSSIMQSTAAMFALLIAVFVLVIQNNQNVVVFNGDDRVVKVANFQPLRKFQRKIFPFQKILHLLKGSSS